MSIPAGMGVQQYINQLLKTLGAWKDHSRSLENQLLEDKRKLRVAEQRIRDYVARIDEIQEEE